MRTAARVLAEELFYGAGKVPTAEVVEQTVSHVSPAVPHFVHALVHETVAQCSTRLVPAVTDVSLAYEHRLLGSPGNWFFRDFLLRERAYPDHCRQGAAGVLRALAHADEPVPESDLQEQFAAGRAEPDLFEPMMTCLQEDYDLAQSADGWSMRCRVLADRWRRGEHWLTRSA